MTTASSLRRRPIPVTPLAGAALWLALPAALLVVRPGQLLGFQQLTAALVAVEALWWALAFALLAYVRFVEGEPLASLDLRRPRLSSLGWGLAGCAALLVLLSATQALLAALGQPPSQAQQVDLAALPAWLIIAMALRAGVVEELIFRGYAITRLSRALNGRAGLAAAISLATFVLLHVRSWSPGHLVFVAAAGGLLTGLYLWRKDLSANMIAHLLVDLAGLLTAKYLAPAG